MKRYALCLLGLSSALLLQAEGRLEITANVPAEFTIPQPGASVRRIVMRGEDRIWRPLEFRQQEGALRFRLLPAQTGGRATLVLDPPEDVDLDDQKPPRLLALQLDDRPTAPVADWRHAAGTPPPKRIRWDIADGESGVAPDTLRILLNGSVLPPARLTLVPTQPRQISVQVDLADLPLGQHHLEASVADRSPDRNSLRLAARFECFDPTNLLRSAPGLAKIAVDSHFESYPSLDPLADGIRQLPGKSAGNDVTWASAETETPHWVDITLRGEATLREVTLYWAREESASRIIEIQVPEGDGWRTVHRADNLPAKQCVQLAFAPVKSSRLRILQPKGGGSTARPNLLWLTEIEAR